MGGSEGVSRKTRLIDVVYNASNNELVRTKTLVKNAIIVVDATPFKQWYETHYGLPIGKKKGGRNQSEVDEAILNKPRSNHLKRKLEEQFAAGRLYACVSSRPGQSGRCDGYILEGK